MKVLEIDCNNCNYFNMLFVSELKEYKEFYCDDCNNTILIVDRELLNQLS